MSIAAAEILPDKRVTSFVKERRKLLIGGQWADAASGKTFPVQNPATGETLAATGATIKDRLHPRRFGAPTVGPPSAAPANRK